MGVGTLLYFLFAIIIFLLIIAMIRRKMITSKRMLLFIGGAIIVILIGVTVSKLMQPNQQEIEIISNLEVLEGIDITNQTLDGRYLLLSAIINGQKEKTVYDTHTNKVIDELDMFTELEPLTINEKGSILEIVDKQNKTPVFSLDLQSVGFEKVSNEARLQPVQWSTTKKYCFVSQFVKDKLQPSILIDISNKSILQMPVGGITEIKWSSDDKKAILRYFTDDKVNDSRISKNAFWNLENGDFQQIYFYGEWIPNSNYVFDDSMERYDMTEGFKKDYIRVKKSIKRETIKWISPDEAVFITQGEKFHITDLIPFVKSYIRFLKPVESHANKIDFKKKKLTEMTIDAQSSKDYFWSSDNDWLYYINNSYGSKKGLYKMRVGFGR